MPNNESFYDNTKLAYYIKLTSNDSTFNTHIINELDNHDIQTVILDLKETKGNLSIEFLIERLKQFGNIITITNNNLPPTLLSKVQEITSSLINYDTLSFRDEKQKEDFETDIITNILNLPLEKVEKLLEYNGDIFNDTMVKNYLELILKDYGNYVSPNTLENLKNTILNLKGLSDNEVLYNIFASLVSPAYSSKLDINYNEKIKQSFIDMAILDFSHNHEVLLDYEAKYPSYVIYLKEKLSFIEDKETLAKLLFSGNIDAIIELTGLTNEELEAELKNIDEKNTSYEKLLHEIASLSPKHATLLENYLLKLSTRVNTKEEALSIINTSIGDLMPELKSQTESLIANYLNQINNTITI